MPKRHRQLSSRPTTHIWSFFKPTYFLGFSILLSTLWFLFSVKRLGIEIELSKDNSSVRTKPLNVLILYGDDWRHDVLGIAGSAVQTPFLDRLAEEGVRFTHKCVTTSVCWISRATLHTGQYLSRHKGQDFLKPLWYSQWNTSYPYLLRKHGYHVGHVGKWHFDGWRDLMPNHYDWYRIYEGKHWYGIGGTRVHTTKRNQRDAITFLRERPKDKPFLLTVAFFAPHAVDVSEDQYYPMPKSLSLYQNISLVPMPVDTFSRLPSFFTDENQGRRRWQMRFDTPEKYETSLKNYFRLISEVDAACERIVKELKSQGMLDRTLVIFTTDNGYYHAEHGLADKWYPHEESIRVPLIVHDPRMPSSQRGSVNDEFVLNIDLAPTIVGAADLEPPSAMQGKDFSVLYRTGLPRVDWRTDFFYEHPMLYSPHAIPASSAIVRKDSKYIFWPDWNVEQLFDLKKDPNEENDVIHEAEYSEHLQELRARHETLREAVK